jgi:hypothetical protein
VTIELIGDGLCMRAVRDEAAIVGMDTSQVRASLGPRAREVPQAESASPDSSTWILVLGDHGQHLKISFTAGTVASFSVVLLTQRE